MAAGRLRTWLAGSGIALSIVILLVAVGLVALDLGWQRRWIADFALERARERLGMEVEIDRIGGRLTRGLDLVGVRIGDPEAPLFEADRIRIRWRVQSFVDPAEADEWVVQRVQVEGWSALLERGPEGRWSTIEDLVARLGADGADAEPAPTEPGPGLRLRRLDIDPGRVEVRLAPVDGAAPATANATPAAAAPWRLVWEAQARGRELRIGPGEPLSIARLEVDARIAEDPQGLPLALDRADLQVALVERRIESARLEIAAPGLVGLVEGRGTLDELDAGRIEIDALRLDVLAPWLEPWTIGPGVPGGRVHLEADASGPTGRWTGDLALEAHDLQDAARRVGALRLEARLDEPITTWPPNLRAIDAALKLDARGLALADLAPVGWPQDPLDLRAAGRARAGRLALDALAIEGPGCSAQGRGGVDERGLEDFAASFRCDDLARWTRGASGDGRLAGRAEGRLEATGPYASPSGTASITTAGLTIGERSVGDLAIDARRPRDGAAPGSRARSSRPLSMELRWRDGDEAVATGEAEIDLDRRTASFALAAQPALAEKLRPGWAGPPTRGAAKGHLALESARVRLRLLEAEASTPDVQVALGAPLEVSFDEADARWSVDAPELQVEAIGRADAAGGGDARPERATLALRARGLGAMPRSLDLELGEVAADALLAFAPALPVSGGRIGGHARLSWPPDHDDWADLALHWTSPRVSGLALDAVDWKATGRPGVLDGRVTVRVANEEPLSIRTSLPVDAGWRALPGDWPVGTTLEARLEQLDLALFTPWVPISPRWARDAGGRASGRLAVVQRPDGPEWSGALEIDEGRATLPLLGQSLRDFEARVAFDADAVTLESMRVRAARGEATIDGRIVLDVEAGLPITGRLRFDEFSLSRSRLLQADLSGEVDLEGTVDAPILRGALTLERAELHIPESRDAVLREILLVAGRSDAGLVEGSAPPRSGLAERSDVDVTLRVPRTTRIRGQGANLYVEGKVAAVQRPGQPLRVVGETNVVNGTFTFQGKRFRVRRGRVRLAGDERVDPLLDIEATLPVRDIVAIVEVTGRLSEPIVRLRSEPSRSEQDVLAYLLFGRPASEVGAAQGNAFGAAATAVVAGVAERELREILGNAMFVDTIEIGANEEGETESLGVGRFLGPDVFVRYVHVLGDEPADRVGVEYRINSLFSVGSSVSTTGDTGLDLIFRYDF